MKHWRTAYGTDALLTETLPHTPELERYYPTIQHKHDKLGRPIYIEPLGRQDIKALLFSMDAADDMVRFHVQRVVRQNDLCEKHTERFGRKVNQVMVLVDLTGTSTKRNLTKISRDFIKEVSAVGQNYFPETLGKMFIMNAPSAFNMAWRFVKPFLDKRTLNKIEVLKGNPRERLLEFIDADCLPPCFGGTCSCPGGCIPPAEVEDVIDDGEDVDAEVV
eukprot:CAMPEP_0114567232 /NCGR_PEP_ID=MMETSP0114-20121206/15359_1 /TAXON_ID=31324 /ORGANISM="Goniomonas sp, Strain m" /LENGTH=218 /DNA_ID=CAMNT_0001753783 /DNA_START=120 /DNA_END=777 /DNA_ORIENTATION=-